MEETFASSLSMTKLYNLILKIILNKSFHLLSLLVQKKKL